MTWTARVETPLRSLSALPDVIRQTDASVLPRPADLSVQERADFLDGRTAWMEAARVFMTSHHSVSGELRGWRDKWSVEHVALTFQVQPPASSDVPRSIP